MLQRFRKSIFLRNVTTLFTGAAIAQVIPLILSPFISRTFSAGDVAVFGIYSSIIGLFGAIVSLRYELAIIVPKGEQDSRAILVLSILVAAAVSVILLGTSALVGDYFVTYIENERIAQWLPTIPLVLLVIGAYNATNYYLIRRKMFVPSALNKVAHRASEGISNVSMGLLSVPSGLIISDVIGRCCSLAMSFYQIRKSLSAFKNVRVSDLVRVAKRYRHYPINLGPSSLANAASMHLPIFFISNAFSVQITGLFNFMRFVLYAPISFFGQNISQVFLERLAEKSRNQRKVVPDLLKLTLVMTMASMLIMLPIALLGPFVFELVFGEDWREAGEYAQIMSISFFFKFIVSPLSPTLNAINRIHVASIWQWFNFGFTMLLIPISVSGIGIKKFLFVYAFGEMILYVIYWLMIFFTAKRHDGMLAE